MKHAVSTISGDPFLIAGNTFTGLRNKSQVVKHRLNLILMCWSDWTNTIFHASRIWITLAFRPGVLATKYSWALAQNKSVKFFKYPVLIEDYWLKPCIYAFVLTPGLKPGVIQCSFFFFTTSKGYIIFLYRLWQEKVKQVNGLFFALRLHDKNFMLF